MTKNLHGWGIHAIVLNGFVFQVSNVITDIA